MQTRTTQRPARPHAPQLLESAPSKRTPNHNNKRDQQPGSSQINAWPAMQPCHVPTHSHKAALASAHKPQPAPSGEACLSLPITLPCRGPRRQTQHCPKARDQCQERGQVAGNGKRCLLVQAQGSPSISTCLHLCHCFPTSVTPVVCFTSKVCLLWACRATAACSGQHAGMSLDC